MNDQTFGSVYKLDQMMGQFYYSGTPTSSIKALFWCDHTRRCIGLRYLG